MKLFLSVTVFAYTIVFLPMISCGESVIPADSDFLSSALSQALTEVLEDAGISDCDSASIIFGEGITLSGESRKKVEAIFTSKGITLIESCCCSCKTFLITIPEARIIITRDYGYNHRFAGVSLHIRMYDASSRVIFTGRRHVTVSDNLLSSQLVSTDDAGHFSPDIQRIAVSVQHDRLRNFSFFLITAILVFYAFQ